MENLMNNSGLTLKQLLHKRDLIQELINLDYDLRPELTEVIEAIQKKAIKINLGGENVT